MVNSKCIIMYLFDCRGPDHKQHVRELRPLDTTWYQYTVYTIHAIYTIQLWYAIYTIYTVSPYCIPAVYSVYSYYTVEPLWCQSEYKDTLELCRVIDRVKIGWISSDSGGFHSGSEWIYGGSGVENGCFHSEYIVKNFWNTVVLRGYRRMVPRCFSGFSQVLPRCFSGSSQVSLTCTAGYLVWVL